MKVFIILFLLPCSLYAVEIKAVSDIWPPYIINLEKSKGYLVEVLVSALKREDVTLKLMTKNYSSSLKSISKGETDILIGCTNNGEQAGSSPIKISLAQIEYGFFLKTNNPLWKYTGIKSLKKLKMGIISGYGYGDEIDRYISSKESNIKRYKADTPLIQLIKDLQSGEIDIFAQDITVTNYTLKNSFSSVKLRMSQFPRGKGNLFMCISNKSKHNEYLFEILSRNLEIMQEDGTMKKIREKYSISH